MAPVVISGAPRRQPTEGEAHKGKRPAVQLLASPGPAGSQPCALTRHDRSWRAFPFQ